jgi:sugar lactone lactonase YvrE
MFQTIRMSFALLFFLVGTHWSVAEEIGESQISAVVGGLLQSEGGDWNPSTSPLKSPFGLDFDSAGNLYVVELTGGRVHRLDTEGNLTQISGDGSKSYKGDGGPAIDATFNGMHNCAVTKEDQLLIADSWNHCVREIDLASGKIETIIGTGEEGFHGENSPADQATFNFVMCITLNHSKDKLHVIDLKNRRVRDVDLATGIVTTVAGNGTKGVPKDGALAVDSPLVDPRAVASDSKGNLYILERGGHAIRVVRVDGTIHTIAGTGKKGHRDGEALTAMFGSPKHICVDEQDNVYVADDTNKAIRKFDPKAGTIMTILGRGYGDPRIELLHPHGVTVHNGSLYVLDTGHNRILKMPL